MEADEYRKMAAVEDTMWYYAALHEHVRSELARTLTDRKAKILDVGCGTGGLMRRLSSAEPAWRWTGIELSPLACELARSRTSAEIVEASATKLPFDNSSFDAVVSTDVLYHIEDDSAALREMARVLRPGGVMIINVPAHRWLWSYHDEATHAKRRYERGELREMLEDVGLDPVRVTHWNTLLLPLVIARRKLMPAPKDGSDVREYSAPVDALCRTCVGVERAWLKIGGRFPVGTSILATARKGADELDPINSAVLPATLVV